MTAYLQTWDRTKLEAVNETPVGAIMLHTITRGHPQPRLFMVAEPGWAHTINKCHHNHDVSMNVNKVAEVSKRVYEAC
jgi:hypothetical protein